MPKEKSNDPSLLHDSTQFPTRLGCQGCPDLKFCGGLAVKKAMFDCTTLCTCTPSQREKCELACPLNPSKLVTRFREIGGWDLVIPPARFLPTPKLPSMVPLIKDGARRRAAYRGRAVGIRLESLFSKRNGAPRFKSRTELCDRYRLSVDTPLLINGIHIDQPLERYWDKGRAANLAEHISALKPDLMTVPNFSLFTDVPRHENMYNMRRIVTSWYELVECNVPCALHLNARTDHDWTRWIAFLGEHPEITAVAFEFTTGAAGRRGKWYCRQLLKVASASMRPLTLVLRGGSRYLRRLAREFEQVVFVYAKPYVATMNRQSFVWAPGQPLEWESTPTAPEDPLDSLFAHNVSVAEQMVASRIGMRIDSTPLPL